jgi:hypothetical protein
MLEHPLAGEDHGHLGIRFVAGRDGFKVPVEPAGLHDRRDALLDSHVHAVPEREERVGDHGGTDKPVS